MPTIICLTIAILCLTAALIAKHYENQKKSSSFEGLATNANAILPAEISSEGSTIVSQVNGILSGSIADGATKIAIIPEDLQVSVRYFIGDSWQEVETIGKASQDQLINRLKVMSGINYYKTEQSGKISMEKDERSYEMLVTVQPSEFGDQVALALV